MSFRPSRRVIEHKFITEDGLKRLDEYKYISGGYSWLDNKMNPFWLFFVEKLTPEWLAPNLMTTIGFFFMSLAYLIMLFFDCSLTQDVPRWTYFLAAACIFIYQTLDACDGKQARRTKSSSPLGQLVDHGCDSFALNFMFLSVIQATGIPRFHIIFCFVAMQYIFWTSQWYENHTKILKTNVGNLGVTEIELIMIALLVLTGIFGRETWGITARELSHEGFIVWVERGFANGKHFLDQPLYEFIYWVIVVIMIILNIIMVLSILVKQQNKLEQIAQFIPISGVVFLEILVYQIPILQEKYLGLVLMTFGVLFSLICCKIIICSMTEMKFPILHKETVIPFILTICLYLTHKNLDEKSTVIVFSAIIFFTLVGIYRFLHGVITEITAHLGIFCFTLRKRGKDE